MLECYAMQIPKTKKTKITKKKCQKEYREEAYGPRKPKMIRDTESDQSLDEVS